jgi:tetratricopeptide (TPR) repeat protein
MDDIAIAAAEVDADRLDLLAEPASVAISSLWDEVARLARSSNRTPHDCFTAARTIRSQALDVAERTRRPSALSDLYLAVGASTALMASAAFDLHRWDVSERLSQSAISYAEITGNNSLLTWTTGLAALLANWRDEPDEALRYFHQAVELSPPGIPKVRLRYIAARSYALLGDAAAVRQVVDDANQDHDDSTSHRDLLADEVGGEFAFGTPRAAACVAAAWLDVGQGRQAAESAQRALAELTNLPVSRQPVSQVTGARIDLATAHVMCGELDGAAEIITDSVGNGSILRNASLAGRLARTHDALTSKPVNGSSTGQHLAEVVDALIRYQSDGPESAPQ